MAQLLYERHSTNVHLNIVKRHIRLARQFKGAEALVTSIEPFYNELAVKAANTNSATDETECKRDLLAFIDVSLDDKVRDLYEACKKYDRDHPGIPVTALLFPDGISPVVYAPVETEPTLVEKLILGVQSLGEAHLLTEHIGTPRYRAIASRGKEWLLNNATRYNRAAARREPLIALFLFHLNYASKYCAIHNRYKGCSIVQINPLRDVLNIF